MQMIKAFKQAMTNEFEMTNLGPMKYFLGIQVKQEPGRIFISQAKYAYDLLKRFNMIDCKPAETPMSLSEKLSKNDGKEKVDESIYRSLVGSLIYLTNTRPDIVYSVSIVSRFMDNPSKAHFAAAKRILRYVNGTKNFGIMYKKEEDNRLKGYTNNDWAGSLDDRKSTSGYIFCLGTKVTSWSSKKQNVVALSTAKAEYISSIAAACEALWLRRLLQDLQDKQEDATTLFCDNMSAIAMSKNPVFHARSKHIELKYHFIRELVENEDIKLEFCNKELMI